MGLPQQIKFVFLDCPDLKATYIHMVAQLPLSSLAWLVDWMVDHLPVRFMFLRKSALKDQPIFTSYYTYPVARVPIFLHRNTQVISTYFEVWSGPKSEPQHFFTDPGHNSNQSMLLFGFHPSPAVTCKSSSMATSSTNFFSSETCATHQGDDGNLCFMGRS